MIALQGVRSYDPNIGTWTTPDAYRGDLRDPQSQMPYMRNHSNPYSYSDPSGYDPVVSDIGGNVTITYKIRFIDDSGVTTADEEAYLSNLDSAGGNGGGTNINVVAADRIFLEFFAEGPTLGFHDTSSAGYSPALSKCPGNRDSLKTPMEDWR